MSTLLEERPPALAPARPALRGLLRVSVRQHRTALLIGAGAIVVGVLVLVAVRIWAGSVADDFAATGCSIFGPDSDDCYQKARDFSDDMFVSSQATEYGSLFLQLLPGVLGVFVAGPVVARELESGTYKLAWTQSVTPARWFASKLLPVAVPVLLLVPLLTAVRAWVSSSLPDSNLYPPPVWYESTTYLSLGTAPLAYALLGIAVGALAGMLVARTVPAMSLALLPLGGMFLTMNFVRDSLWPPTTATVPVTSIEPSVGGNESWWLEGGYTMANGDQLTRQTCTSEVTDELVCLRDKGVTGRFVEYHPGSHFWPIQLVETGIVLMLATACALAAFKVLGRRHA